MLRPGLLVCLLSLFSAGTVAAGGEGKTMLKQDHVPPIFAAGPSVADVDFESWLKATRLPVKLPFTIWRAPHRVGAIGVHDAMPATVLSFSDSRLGISLDDRLHQTCGEADPCHIWLEGQRGVTVPLPASSPLSASSPSDVFEVHAVHGPVEGAGPHAAQVVRDDACLAIRLMKPLHCARGPARCEKCKAAQASAPSPKLLDVCPHGDVARPTIEIERDGKTFYRSYDVLQTFADIGEARTFAKRHGVTDVVLK